MNQPSPPALDRLCPECGALNAAQASVCWLCRSAAVIEVLARDRVEAAKEEPATRPGTVPPASGLPDTAQAVGGTHFEAPSAAHHAHFQFSLASLMLTITLCAVLLGAATISPGLGIILGLLAAPVFIHTAAIAVRRREHGQRMGAMEKTASFVGVLAAIMLAIAGAGIAFFVTCFGGMFAGAAVAGGKGEQGLEGAVWGVEIGIGLGLAAGVVVLVLLVRLFLRLFSRI
jgi:hypothetical protein